MFQMVLDTACITHTTGWNDYLGLLIIIDRLRIITGDGNLQSRETDWINSLFDQFHRFFIKTVILMLRENRGSFICKRTVHIYFKSVMSIHQSVCLDLSDKVQHFLRTSHCKRRNHKISSSVKGFLDDFRQQFHIIRLFSMTAVTVSGFHNYIICMVQILRILDQGLAGISNISGEYNLFLCILLPDRQLNTCRAQQMACINKPGWDSLCRSNHLIVRASHKVSDHSHGIFHCISRNKFRFALSSAFTVSPFCFKHLNVRTISEHNIA